MKKKFPNFLFIISFLPYLFVVACGIEAAICGIPDGLFSKTLTYGMDVFWLVVVTYTCIFSYIPIIPICLVFQIFYILRKTVRKFKEVELKKYILVACIVEVFLIIIIHCFLLRS